MIPAWILYSPRVKGRYHAFMPCPNNYCRAFSGVTFEPGGEEEQYQAALFICMQKVRHHAIQDHGGIYIH